MYPALEKGTIDALEWVGPYDDQKLGFNKVAQFYYYPGWWEGGPQLDFYINTKAWEGLSAEYKAIVDAAAAHANIDMTAKYDARNPVALKQLVGSGTKLRPFPQDVMNAAFKSASRSTPTSTPAIRSGRRSTATTRSSWPTRTPGSASPKAPSTASCSSRSCERPAPAGEAGPEAQRPRWRQRGFFLRLRRSRAWRQVRAATRSAKPVSSRASAEWNHVDRAIAAAHQQARRDHPFEPAPVHELELRDVGRMLALVPQPGLREHVAFEAGAAV